MQSQAQRLMDLFDRLRAITLEWNPIGDLPIGPRQVAALECVASAPGCNLHHVAECLKLTRPTVTVGVQRLEAEGLLRREADERDQRAVRLFLTPAGEEFLRRSRAYRREKMERLLAGLSLDEQETLLRLLERALQASEEAARPDDER